MELSNLDRGRTIAGALASAALVLSLFFLEWYGLSTGPQREEQQAWVCGEGDYSCTGWETLTIIRFLLILVALSPAILGYILLRGHKLSYPPGEMTMIAGFAGSVLIAYNGLFFKPQPVDGIDFGVSLAPGYWIALVASIAIGVVGFLRSQESGGRQQRKAPGTV